MGFFKGMFEIVTTPVAVVKDIVTLGGVATDQEETYTRQKMREIEESFED